MATFRRPINTYLYLSRKTAFSPSCEITPLNAIEVYDFYPDVLLISFLALIYFEMVHTVILPQILCTVDTVIPPIRLVRR